VLGSTQLLLWGLQVGSKNAAFYLGKRIKVATRQAGGAYVHELSIGASDLEQRYRDGQVSMPTFRWIWISPFVGTG
jgi:hypothetical protein